MVVKFEETGQRNELREYFETTESVVEASSDSPSQPPRARSKAFVFEGIDWDSLRDSGITPTNASTLGVSERDRAEFLRGAELLRLRGPGKFAHAEIQPQQLHLSDMLAGGRPKNAVLLPRRSSKSTTLMAIGLGRAEAREDYRVGILTLTTGKAGRSRFKKDVVPALDRLYPDKLTRPFTISLSAGMESVTFKESGGFMAWLSTEDDLRGEAFDLVILDEGGEPDPVKVQDVIAAALPTLDTRPGAQLVVAGTAGAYREGNLLWDWLENGRHDDWGILEYAAPDSTTDEELADWEPSEDHPAARVRELVESTHPGVGGLTSLETIKGNFQALSVEVFSREYLSIFGTAGATTGIVDMVKWAAAATSAPMPKPPARFTLVMAVHRDLISAALIAVWREKGKAHLGVIEHKRGVQWVAKRAVALSRQYSTPIVHDTLGPVTVEVEAIGRERPKVRTLPQTFPNIKTAAALLVKEIEGGNVIHYNQTAMNEAARLATKRPIGPSAWALGVKLREHDTIALEAAAMGLRVYDEGGARAGISVPASMAA